MSRFLKRNITAFSIVAAFLIAICGQMVIMFRTQNSHNLQHDVLNEFTIKIDKETKKEKEQIEQNASVMVPNALDGTTNSTVNINNREIEKKEIPRYPGFEGRNPDGTFNGYNIYYESYKNGWHSNAHCIGENFQPHAWNGILSDILHHHHPSCFVVHCLQTH